MTSETPPDLERLSEIILEIDGYTHSSRLRAARQLIGDDPEWERGRHRPDVVARFFNEKIDGESFAEVATRRCELVFERFRNREGDRALNAHDVMDMVRGAWVEGFMIGQMFQEKGGHREDH